MKNDILNREDIVHLIDVFYEKVKKDNSLAPFFNVSAEFNWSRHLTAMHDFWENVIFNSGDYEGNPMATHNVLHQMKSLKVEHFKLWLNIFRKSVNENYKGKNANLIKKRANSIAAIMQTKLFG